MLGNDLHGAEVDDSDGAVQAEPVVARMKIGVERRCMLQGRQAEPPQCLAPRVFEFLAGLLRLYPVDSVDVGHGQHALGGQFRHGLRHTDEGMSTEQLVE